MHPEDEHMERGFKHVFAGLVLGAKGRPELWSAFELSNNLFQLGICYQLAWINIGPAALAPW